jgi:hypothetical protein
MVHTGGKSHKLLMMAPAYSFNYFLLYGTIAPAFRRRLIRSAKVQCRHCCEIYYGENSLYRETLKSYLISTFPFRDFHFVLTPQAKYMIMPSILLQPGVAKVSCCTSIQCWGTGAI